MNTQIALFFLILTVLCLSTQAFSPFARNMKMRQPTTSRYMSEEVTEEPDFITPLPNTDADVKLFDMNRRVRLGRSRDQDGKSNIWSIEPTMQVVEEEEGGVSKNLVIGGAVIAAALVCLPLFSTFSMLFPDPADF